MVLALLLTACVDPADSSVDPAAPDTADTADTATDPTDTAAPSLTDWYVDCAAGRTDGAGHTPDTALASLATLAATPLGPGDHVWFVSGTVCAGTLVLQGEGAEGAPLTVGAFGPGAAPRIDGTGAEAAARFEDQGWLDVSRLELTGSSRYGLLLTAATEAVRGVRLHDLAVHDVGGGPLDSKATGLVVATVTSDAGWFEGLEIDHVAADTTDQWAGIFVYGVAFETGAVRSAGVRVHDNVVHDVAGDGVVVFGADDVELDSNLAYEVGLADTADVGTPNGVWTWDCHDCTVQFNEAHHVHSPGVDGGAFDIDWATTDNVVQYNYGHDNDGYCVAVFAAEGYVTTGAVVRYNVCADNGQAADDAFQGDVYAAAWDGGRLGDVQVYNNTVVRGTQWGYPALVVVSPLGAGSGVWNNVFVVGGDWLVSVVGSVAMNHNLYAQLGSPAHAWFDDGAGGWADGLPAWQARGDEAASVWGDPAFAPGTGKDALRLTPGSPAVDAGLTLPDDGGCDGFGAALTGPRDLGAHELAATPDAACGGTP